MARMLTESTASSRVTVAGGRGRRLRPVVIPGNLVELQLAARPRLNCRRQLELLDSRGLAGRTAAGGGDRLGLRAAATSAARAAAVPDLISRDWPAA